MGGSKNYVKIGHAHLRHTAEKKKEVLIKKSMQEPNTGCWIWMGTCLKGGYGQSNFQRKGWLAHRLSYTLFIGPIPEGLTLDHLCRNPACINPHHLEPVTMKENTMRGWSFSRINAEKTHCPQDHKYDDKNTFVNNRGRRECRICMNKRSLARYHKIQNEKRGIHC